MQPLDCSGESFDLTACSLDHGSKRDRIRMRTARQRPVTSLRMVRLRPFQPNEVRKIMSGIQGRCGRMAGRTARTWVKLMKGFGYTHVVS
jgi:hypothetical protein